MVEQLQFFTLTPNGIPHSEVGKTIGEQVWGWKFESWQVNLDLLRSTSQLGTLQVETLTGIIRVWSRGERLGLKI